MTTERKVANAIQERGRFLFIGILPFYLRPITYGQILDMSAVVKEMEDVQVPERDVDLLASVMKMGANAKSYIEVSKIIVFRSSLTRWLFGRYISSRLSQKHFKEITKFLTESLDFGFFLTSTILLKGMNATAPTKETTAPGLSSQPAESTTEWEYESLSESEAG